MVDIDALVVYRIWLVELGDDLTTSEKAFSGAIPSF